LKQIRSFMRPFIGTQQFSRGYPDAALQKVSNL
jgi:hypothetical protein